MNWLKRFIFRKEILEYEKWIDRLYGKKWELEKEISKNESGINYSNLDSILNKSCNQPFTSLIYIGKNKKNEECLVLDMCSSLYIYRANKIQHIGVLHYVLHTDEKRIYIEDFYVNQSNVGNGSLLMEALFKIAKRNDIKKITGGLSPVDEKTQKEKELRDSFYKKHGFTISGRHIEKLF